MATVKIKFRPSRVAGREGTLYFQVVHHRGVRQIRTGHRIFAEEWENGKIQYLDRDIQPGRAHYLKSVERRLFADRDRLLASIRRLERAGVAYTVGQVVNAYWAAGEDEGWLCVFVRAVVQQLKRIGKTRLSETYTSSMNSFMRFRGELGDVRLDEITSGMMMEYEAYLKGLGLVPNTTSFYMRNLRAIYNRAVDKGLTEDGAPFKHVYTGVEKTAKRAVSSQIIGEIKALDLSQNSSLEQARDFFMFSFYTRGMSFVDMAFLKKTDLQNGTLVYRRQKTEQQLCIKWEKPMQDIVDKYHDPRSPYLLPIIRVPGSEERRQYLNAMHRMNFYLKGIGERVKSPVRLTSYVARHGWASIAQSRNVPIAVISEAMGHDSENTTRIYLASLDSSLVDKANSTVIYSI